MARRTQARKLAVQLLYQYDLNADVPFHVVRAMVTERFRDTDLAEFAWWLYTGVMDHRESLDALIDQTSENWKLSRMAPTDRNILRLGAFEILHGDTPRCVAIDEAIELAKEFGSEQSPQFVNGLLDQLDRPVNQDEQ